MKKICCYVLALLLLWSPALALTVLSPDDDFYVLDDAGVLSRDTISHIIFNNDDLYEACGAQIVFVTLDSTRPNDIADYVYTLFNQWGVGDGKKNNGIVVLLAIQDDDYYYMQGTGLERSLSSGEMSELADKWLEPSFAQKDYDQGCRLFFDALFERVASIYKVKLSPRDYPASQTAPRERVVRRGGGSGPVTAARRASDPDDDGGFSVLLAVLIVLAVLFFVFVGSRRGGCGCLPGFLGGFLGSRIGGYGPSRRRPPSSSGPFGGFGGGRSGGGGVTRGGGSGRSSGSFGSFGGGRSGGSSGSFGGGRSGGGGSTRGGGGGRGR